MQMLKPLNSRMYSIPLNPDYRNFKINDDSFKKVLGDLSHFKGVALDCCDIKKLSGDPIVIDTSKGVNIEKFSIIEGNMNSNFGEASFKDLGKCLTPDLLFTYSPNRQITRQVLSCYDGQYLCIFIAHLPLKGPLKR